MDYKELAKYAALAKEGENSAFTYLYEHTYHIIYNIACVILGDADEAKEVLADVYLRAFKILTVCVTTAVLSDGSLLSAKIRARIEKKSLTARQNCSHFCLN